MPWEMDDNGRQKLNSVTTDPFKPRYLEPAVIGPPEILLNGKKTWPVCDKCHATFDGKYNLHVQRNEYIPQYEGGQLIYISERGNSVIFKCSCIAGQTNYRNFAPAPSWYWELFVLQGKVQPVYHPKRLSEIQAGRPITLDRNDSGGHALGPGRDTVFSLTNQAAGAIVCYRCKRHGTGCKCSPSVVAQELMGNPQSPKVVCSNCGGLDICICHTDKTEPQTTKDNPLLPF